MGKHRLRYSWGSAAVAVALLVPVASGSAAATPTTRVPAKLVGTWTRTVTKADIKRAHVPPTEAGEVYPGLTLMLAVNASGAASLKTAGPKGGGRWAGRLVPVGPDRVHITIPFDFPNVYRWRVSALLLTLTKISDSERIGARAAWFTGVWKRK